MPFSRIIITANSVSRAKVGSPCPCRLTAEMLTTSTATTDSVRIRVPNGSPRRIASRSAWRTTAMIEPSATPNSQTNTTPSITGLERAASSARPWTKNTRPVSRLPTRNHSWRSSTRQAGPSEGVAAGVSAGGTVGSGILSSGEREEARAVTSCDGAASPARPGDLQSHNLAHARLLQRLSRRREPTAA